MRDERPSQSYLQACSAIMGVDKQIWGSGIAIGRKRFVTCAHVVAKALGHKPDADEADLGAAEGLQVWLPFFWGAQAEPVQARLVNYYSRAELGGASDLAVLELTEEPPCRTISVPELPSFLVDQPNLVH